VGAAPLTLIVVVVAAVVAAGAAYLLWRHVWFFRNPQRTPPPEAGIVSPADGTVVYVRNVEPGEEVVVIKKGRRATVKDILRQDVNEPKVVIGIFMSPFDVHFNRAPVDAAVGFIRHYPSLGGNAYMGAMHWRTFFGVEPYYANSVHIMQNERTVTYFAGEFRGAALPVYVVQIGARTVNGIDSYCQPGERIARGATFGMIRIGSQVDLIVPQRASLAVAVRPGDRVRAGETIVMMERGAPRL
jgi:phosphatidylserine decarboxylase